MKLKRKTPSRLFPSPYKTKYTRYPIHFYISFFTLFLWYEGFGYTVKENEWRAGKIDYLERACMMNLNKLAFIMKQIRLYARDHQLKPSWTSYHQSGKKGNNRPLCFSKSGNEQIERAYATHYVDQKRIAQLKQKKAEQTDKQRAEKQSGTQSVG